MKFSADTLTSNFPYPIVTKLHGFPTYEALDKLRQQICANASSVQSIRGVGNHGHVGMFLEGYIYNTLSNTIWTNPINSGPLANARANNVRDLARHNESVVEWNTFGLLQNILKQQVIKAVNKIYIVDMEEDYIGYSNVSLRQLFMHLFTSYGTIHASEPAALLASIANPINPDCPLATLWKRIKKAVQFSNAAQAPLTGLQVMNTLITVLTKTGTYTNNLRNWNKLPNIQKTYVNAKIFFNTAYTTNMAERKMSGQFGAPSSIAASVESFTHKATETMTQLANAAEANQRAYQAVQQQNQLLTNMIQEQQKQMAELQAVVMANGAQQQPIASPTETLMAQMQALLLVASNSKNTGNAQKRKGKRKVLDKEKILYCYTHGYTPNKRHTGYTCTNKCPGHKDEATKRNQMGGSIQNYNKYGVNFLA